MELKLDKIKIGDLKSTECLKILNAKKKSFIRDGFVKFVGNNLITVNDKVVLQGDH